MKTDFVSCAKNASRTAYAEQSENKPGRPLFMHHEAPYIYIPWGMRGPDRSYAIAPIVLLASEFPISTTMLMYKQIAFTAFMHGHHHVIA